MHPKEIIEKLKLTFNELVNAQPTSAPIALMSTTLVDGTPIEITDLVVGGVVTIDGVPAPIGEHTLVDGTIIVVGDNGAITEIKVATSAPEEVAPAVEDMSAKFSAFELSTSEKFTSYESKFAAYEQRFSDYEGRLDKATKVIEALLNVTATLAETPTGIPDAAVKTSNNFKEEKNYDILFN
jgi:hypothetical protein